MSGDQSTKENMTLESFLRGHIEYLENQIRDDRDEFNINIPGFGPTPYGLRKKGRETLLEEAKQELLDLMRKRGG